MNRVTVAATICGLCQMRVCAVDDATDEEILEVCNRENPSGTEAGWTSVCRTEGEWSERSQPLPCASFPGRTHFMVGC